jgi:hypothetical protein
MIQAFKIRPAGQQSIPDSGDLWQFRHLFYILMWCTLKVRYQQTEIGVAGSAAAADAHVRCRTVALLP